MRDQWRELGRAIKKAALGAGSVDLVGDRYTVAYEARGVWEEGDYRILQALARGRRCVYDVGAYLGITALVMARGLGTGGRLLAFEPTPKAAGIIRENAVLNGLADRITVINAFVGSRPGALVEFHGSEPSVYNSAIASRSALRGEAGIQTALTPAVTLDEVSSATDTTPEFVKIDVEGAELDVLAGMARLLQEARPTVFLELHELPDLDLPAHARAVRERLEPLGYELIRLGTKRPLDPPELAGLKGRTHLVILPTGSTDLDRLRDLDTSRL
jgi:FkbM family methyltransferase